jgi:hypothetical protein
MGTTTETLSTIGTSARGRPFQPGHKIGPRFQKGHPFYPPKPKHGRAKRDLRIIARRIFRAIEEERDGEMTVEQRIHAENAARLGALAKDLFERGELIDPTVLSTLINSQQREMELMNA